MISRNLRLAGCTALFCAIALMATPFAAATLDGGRDRAPSTPILVDDALDPAIRGALLARSTPVASGERSPAAVQLTARGDGFAWGAAGIGAGVGIAVVGLVAASVMVLGQRHDRLRNA